MQTVIKNDSLQIKNERKVGKEKWKSGRYTDSENRENRDI
jgi:hypothetical protein